MKTISIITNKKVDKTFEGEDCLLKRTIISTFKENNYKRYVIVTERCNYYTEQLPKIDSETGEQILDKDGKIVYEDISILRVINKKDKESVQKYSFEQINFLFEQIKDNVPSNLNKMETENLEEQLALLTITKLESPWGTVGEDWINLTTE